MMSEQPHDHDKAHGQAQDKTDGQTPGRIPADAETRLEAFFAAARTAADAPLPDALQSRLVAGALEQMPPRARTASKAVVQPGLWRRAMGWPVRLGQSLVSSLGGAPGLATVGAAGLAGVWIGAAAPGPASLLAFEVLPAVVAPDRIGDPVGAEALGLEAFGLSDDGALLALMNSD